MPGATRKRSSGVASGTPPIAEASTGTPSASYSRAATQNVSMNPGMTRVGKTPTSEAARRHCASWELMLRSTVRFGHRPRLLGELVTEGARSRR